MTTYTYLHRFHSREYPKYDEKRFPYNLGYCQKGRAVFSFLYLFSAFRASFVRTLTSFAAGSEIPYDNSMDLRNILWLAPLATCTEKGVCSDDWLASGNKSRSLLKQALRAVP